MYEITYTSSASRVLNLAAISSILEAARVYNEKKNITGCLLYYNKEFIQILEGDEEEVLDLFTKISQDNRHTQVQVVAQGTKTERVFSEWSMAFHELGDEDIQDLTKEVFVSNLIAFSALAKKNTFPVLLFWTMARQLLEKRK